MAWRGAEEQVLVGPRPPTIRPPSARGQGVSGSILLGFAVMPRLSAPVSGAPAKDILNLKSFLKVCKTGHSPNARVLGLDMQPS